MYIKRIIKTKLNNVLLGLVQIAKFPPHLLGTQKFPLQDRMSHLRIKAPSFPHIPPCKNLLGDVADPCFASG